MANWPNHGSPRPTRDAQESRETLPRGNIVCGCKLLCLSSGDSANRIRGTGVGAEEEEQPSALKILYQWNPFDQRFVLLRA